MTGRMITMEKAITSFFLNDMPAVLSIHHADPGSAALPAQWLNQRIIS